MPNPVVYFEIAGRDGKRLQEFYAQAFGWTVDAERMPGYGYVDTGGAGDLPGGIRQDPPDKVLYIRVPDLQAALDAVHAGGGTTFLPPMEVPGLTFALFKDPEGNIMGLVKG